MTPHDENDKKTAYFYRVRDAMLPYASFFA